MKITSDLKMSMVRGDTESFSVSCSTPFASGDMVYFTVRRDVESPVVIQKAVSAFTDGKAYFNIEPEDTEGFAFGPYVYDIQVTWASGLVKTIVEKNSFTLREEVTY